MGGGVSYKAECPNCGGCTSNVPKGLCSCGWIHDAFISPVPKWITVKLERIEEFFFQIHQAAQKVADVIDRTLDKIAETKGITREELHECITRQTQNTKEGDT